MTSPAVLLSPLAEDTLSSRQAEKTGSSPQAERAALQHANLNGWHQRGRLLGPGEFFLYCKLHLEIAQQIRPLAALPEVLGSSPSSQLSNSSSRKSGTLTHIRRQNTHEHKVKIRCIRKVHLQSNARNLTLGSDIASQSIPVNLPKNSPFHTNIQKRCLEARSAHADVKGGLPLPNPSGSVAVVSRFAPDSQILYSETVLSATPEKSTFSH